MPRKSPPAQPGIENLAVDANALVFNDPPMLIHIPISVAIQKLWVDNPKLHDIGGVVSSVQKHGFQDLPKFDINLPNVSGGMGAIKSGNGRIEALFHMQKNKMTIPRGVAQIKDTGEWAIPLIVGTDAASQSLAEAYAIDANNLTMMGGDFTALDMLRMYNPDHYVGVLQRLAEGDNLGNVVSVDGSDLDFILSQMDKKEIDFNDFDAPDADLAIYFRVVVDGLTKEQAEEILSELDGARIEQYRA